MNSLVVRGGLLTSDVGVAQPDRTAHIEAMHRTAVPMNVARGDAECRVESLFVVHALLFIE
jgi:hypothetical protein